MKRHLYQWLLLISLTTTLAKDEDLPLCPTNMQFFPQNLPMHCRMPNNNDFPFPEPPHMPTMPPLPPFFQNSGDKAPNLPPLSVPPFPGVPGSMPVPGSLPMPAPMAMPVIPGVPPNKLPVIVMPFYSPDPSVYKKGNPRRPGSGGRKKKKKPFFKKPRYDSDTETSSDTDTETDTDTSSDNSDTSDGSNERGWWKGKAGITRKNTRRFSRKHKLRHKTKKRKDLLMPILQYVTKDGYVIFEKKISKSEAKDWLRNKNSGTGDASQNKADKGGETDNADNTEKEDPKNDVEEIEFKGQDKSNEQRVETSTAPQKHRVGKHHYRKPNTLMTQLTQTAH